jgi:hypothetical protein
MIVTTWCGRWQTLSRMSRLGALLVGAVLGVAGPAHAAPVKPLTDKQRAIFEASPEDPAPEVRGGMNKRLSDLHYVVGNEHFLNAFYEDVKDRGGAYVGVGTDQAYLLIGWQKPELVWLVDYDPAVKVVHQIYMAMFAAAATPKEFYDLFDSENAERAYDAIDARFDGDYARDLKAFYRRHRRQFQLRLYRVRRAMQKAEVPSYLKDLEQYDAVRQLVLGGRVRTMVVDLTDDDGMKGIGETAMKLKVPIRALYLSNAEEYWEIYPHQYRDNIMGLPLDEQSLLLRTKVFRKIMDYVYIVQPLENYRAWLCSPAAENVYDVIGELEAPDPEKLNFVRIEREPPPAPLR